MNLRDESINAGVGRGQGILQGQRKRRGIVEAHVHPVNTEVGARILRRSDDTPAQVSARRGRSDGRRARNPFRRRQAAHETGLFHTFAQALRRDIRIGQFEASHSRVAQGSAGARAVGGQ